MAASMNKVILIGRLGQDPKLSYTQGGSAVANFTMATDEGYKDKQSNQKVEKTEWHKIVCWNQTAEFVGNYLTKGRLVLVEGKLQTRKWQDQQGVDKYTTEIVANNVSFLDSKNDAQGQQPQQGGYQQPQQGAPQQGQQPPQYADGYQPQQGAPRQGQQAPQQHGGGYQQAPTQRPIPDEDLGPAFPSEASGMDDVPF
ncbi:MAG: single-stranded DNA-binding protein [Proteobacteria bacterium]|nr:single-stranded DNA-binding protein [Pseudomonadota bacterium]